jgi:geranylgeranyl diphosphate synthase type II
MQSFKVLAQEFSKQFEKRQFPVQPANLYDPAQYILSLEGKRIRPVLTLLACELFGQIEEDAYKAGNAIEMFHNFTLIHDDIMDKAPLRRGHPTVHTKYNEASAILAGDVMLIHCYKELSRVAPKYIHKLLSVFNKAAREVCEGQQIDMDFENMHPDQIQYEDYVNMIALKTSVLLAASLQMGAIIGGGSEHNQTHLYEFGKNVGIAFQIQDDYLDAYGDPFVFGKQPGGDILVNKKTFLLLRAFKEANATQRQHLEYLLQHHPENKVDEVLQIFRDCKVDQWAEQEKLKFCDQAYKHLDDIAVLSSRKGALKELADYLLTREK